MGSESNAKDEPHRRDTCCGPSCDGPSTYPCMCNGYRCSYYRNGVQPCGHYTCGSPNCSSGQDCLCCSYSQPPFVDERLCAPAIEPPFSEPTDMYKFITLKTLGADALRSLSEWLTCPCVPTPDVHTFCEKVVDIHGVTQENLENLLRTVRTDGKLFDHPNWPTVRNKRTTCEALAGWLMKYSRRCSL
jgi:hypothetical protein